MKIFNKNNSSLLEKFVSITLHSLIFHIIRMEKQREETAFQFKVFFVFTFFICFILQKFNLEKKSKKKIVFMSVNETNVREHYILSRMLAIAAVYNTWSCSWFKKVPKSIVQRYHGHKFSINIEINADSCKWNDTV